MFIASKPVRERKGVSGYKIYRRRGLAKKRYLACVAGARRGRGIGEIRRVHERKGSAYPPPPPN